MPILFGVDCRPKVVSSTTNSDFKVPVCVRKRLFFVRNAAAYSLRKGELQNLLVKHVDLTRRVVLVRQAKGNKDRALPLQASLYGLVSSYLEEYRPKHWLFEGQTGDQYSGTSIQAIFVRAKERSKLPDQLTVHGLRPSYASSQAGPLVPIRSTGGAGNCIACRERPARSRKHTNDADLPTYIE